MSELLVQYLREARAIEASLTQTLKAHVAASPPGFHQARLREHLEETRSHERRLAARIDDLGGGEDPLRRALSLLSAPIGFGLGVARGATRVALTLLGAPLALVRDGDVRGADTVLRNVRAETATEAMEIATYTAIERLAEAEADERTARLAAEIRADEERMIEYLREAVVDLADALSGGTVAGGSHAKTTPATRDPRSEARAPEPEVRDRRPEPPEPIVIEAIGNGGEPAQPEPVHVSEEPELVAEVADPGAEDEAGAEVEVQEPWEGYDRMKASEIEQRLQGASDEEVAVVRLYEGFGKNRQTVIRAADRRLRVGSQ